MLSNIRVKTKIALTLATITSIIFGFRYLQLPRIAYFVEEFPDIHMGNLTQEESFRDTPKLTDTELKVIQIFSTIDQMVPHVTVDHMDNTASAQKSRASIINHKDKYCVGDLLIVQLDVYDYLGNRKTYGGDFLRARIYSPEVKAASSGSIVDFNNGTYHVHFTLYWMGKVHVSLLLMHSSEGVSALWRARNKGFDNIDFIGKFANETQEVQTKCGLYLNTTKDVCEYLDQRDGEYFYCIKPAHVPCEAFTYLKAGFPAHTYLSNHEKSLFDRSNTGVEMKKLFDIIDVISCKQNATLAKEKCKTGMRSPFPGGFYLQNVWSPVVCDMSLFKTPDQINTCLQGKQIYLLGDSTLRQWIEYFPKIVPTLKFLDLHGIGKHHIFMALDVDRNLKIEWIKHGHPFVTEQFYTVKNHAYVARQIDRLEGGRYTAIVITLAHHFRFFPLKTFIRRIINVRKAVERLLLRSPDTKVIVKTENTRDISLNVELLSDFHGYVQYLALNLIFQDLNVGVIDAWDMTVAYASNNAHPPNEVLANEINLFLTYIC